jgi:hypothetical protein
MSNTFVECNYICGIHLSNTFVVLLFVVVALFFVTTTVVLQKALGRIFVMARLCHSNDFGSQ